MRPRRPGASQYPPWFAHPLPAPSPEDGSHGTIEGKSVLVRDGDERIRPRLQCLAGARRSSNEAGSEQRNGQAVRMTEFVRLLHRRLASGARLIEVAKI